MIDTKKIREINPMVIGNDCQSNVIHELCDEIDRLQSATDSLKEVLKRIADEAEDNLIAAIASHAIEPKFAVTQIAAPKGEK